MKYIKQLTIILLIAFAGELLHALLPLMIPASIYGLILMLALLMKSRTWRRFSLNEQSDSRVNQVGELGIQPGDIGLTLSRLAPAGKARLRGQMVEVHSSGKFIDQGVGIVVTEVEGYRIVVQPLPPESAPQS